MATEETRTSSVHGDAVNEIYSFYQPHYTEFHRTNLFKLNMSKPESINQADIDEVNAVLRKMYDAEPADLRRVRLLSQLDSGLHSGMQESFVSSVKLSRKFHKVFFVRQPELFLAIMNINNRFVKVNCEKICKDQSVTRQGEFSFELQPVSEFSAKYDSVPPRQETRGPSVAYHAENDGYTQVSYRRSRSRDREDRRDSRRDEHRAMSPKPTRSRVNNRDENTNKGSENSQPRYYKTNRPEYKKYNRNYDSRERYNSSRNNVSSESRSEHKPLETPLSASELDKVESFAKELQKITSKPMNEVFEVPISGSSWATMTEEDENRRLDENKYKDEPQETREVEDHSSELHQD